MADAAPLAALSIEVWLGTYLKRGISAEFADYVLATFTAAAVSARLSDPAEVILLAEADEGIEGYIRLTLPTGAVAPQEAEIATLYVRPACHRRGLGRALLEAALTRARLEGCDSVTLMANTDNAAALAFYVAQGFAMTGRRDFQLNGARYPNHVMRRVL